MTRFEYKVRPAPSKGRKAAGVKGPEARFAHALELVMNEMGSDGWEYVRSDILPSEERQGLTSSHTVYRSVLVFRRQLDDAMPEVFAAPPPADAEATMPEADVETETPADTSDTAETHEAEMAEAEADADDHAHEDAHQDDDTAASSRPV